MRSESEVIRAVGLYADTVRRVCLCRLRDPRDTEDIFQEVLLRYMRDDTRFDSAEHEKAWILRVTLNACSDLKRKIFRRGEIPLEEALQAAQTSDTHREVLRAVLSLKPRYRDAVYLYYYEGYSAKEIAAMLGKRENTVYSLLGRAREQLRDVLGGEA